MIAGDEREGGGGAEVAVNPKTRILKSEDATHRSSVK